MTTSLGDSLQDNSGAEDLMDAIRAAFADVPFPVDSLIGTDDALIQWLRNVFNEKSKVAQYMPSPWMSTDKIYSLFSHFAEFSPEEAQYVFPRLLLDLIIRSMQDRQGTSADAVDMIFLLDINSHMSTSVQETILAHGMGVWLKSFDAVRPDLAEYKFSPFQSLSGPQIAAVVKWIEFVQRWPGVEYYADTFQAALDFWQVYQANKRAI